MITIRIANLANPSPPVRLREIDAWWCRANHFSVGQIHRKNKPPPWKLKEIVDSGSLGDIRYISARRLNLGLFQQDINVAWDLAPHDVSVIRYIIGEPPRSVNCRGSAHLTPGIEDVTTMCLSFSRQQTAVIHSSWLDPRKVREMMIVGSRRMAVYDDIAPLEKIRVFDARVERLPHNDTFAEFNYAYHYGDVHVPYIKPEEPLKTECQHFLDCINQGTTPLTDGKQGLEVVRVLEAASHSLKHAGASVTFCDRENGNGWRPPVPEPAVSLATVGIAA